MLPAPARPLDPLEDLAAIAAAIAELDAQRAPLVAQRDELAAALYRSGQPAYSSRRVAAKAGISHNRVVQLGDARAAA